MSEIIPVSKPSTALALIDDRFKRDDLQSWHEKVDTDRKPILRMAWRVFVGIFLIGGFWAATAPLGGAIVADGRVIAEDRNRIIQHLEGGILTDLKVREGDKVVSGQVIAVLDDTQLKAQIKSNRLQRAILREQLARRRAEANEQEAVQFPRDIHPDVANHPRVLEAIVTQQDEFQAQLKFRVAGAEIIDARIRGQRGDISGLNEVLKAMGRQLELYELELEDFRALLKKGAIDRTRVFATERQVVDLQARIARTNLDIKAAENNIETLGNEKRQNRLAFLSEANRAIVDLQKQRGPIESALERLEDIHARMLIRSPENGTVFRIATRTLGAVVKPGEPIMEIFPDDDALTIEAQLAVRHRDKVKVGQAAAIVFPGDRIKSVTQFPAHLTYISADAVVSERNPQGSYIIRVTMDVSGNIGDLVSGNTAQIFVKTEPKTFFEMLAEPITNFTQNVFNE